MTTQRLAGVGDVVDDEHAAVRDVVEVEDGRQLDRNVEPFVDAGVELDVHRRDVLVPERVRERAADHEAAPGDRHQPVGLVAALVHRLRRGRAPRRRSLRT